MQQHGSNYFTRRLPPPTPHPTLGMGSVGQNSTISEHVYVAYQIRESRMQQYGGKYFARRPHPWPFGWGQ